jgi:subtilase family serine protease
MRRKARNIRRSARRTVPVTVAAAALLAGWASAPGAYASTSTTSTPVVPPFTIHSGPNFTLLPAPLSTAQCRTAYGISCYGPTQLQASYNLAPLYRRGLNGRGKTIVILIPYGSPTLQHDLDVYDHRFGLPDTTLRIVKFGTMPAFDPTDLNQFFGAAGITWQTELAHAIAPGAKIVIAETTVAGNGPTAGLPELMQAEKTLVDEGIGDIFEQMFSTAEGTFPGASTGDFSSLYSIRYAFEDALAHHVTTTTPAGDFGSTEPDADGKLFQQPAVLWPASDPLVTAVGGDEVFLDDAGKTLARPVGWNDFGQGGSGGLSEVFPAPAYQAGVSSVTEGHRAIPDVSLSASVDGGSWIYTSFPGVGGAGWNIFDGTGGATAQFDGVLAIADQLAGHRLGDINPGLYQLGRRSEHGDRNTGLVDITDGNNGVRGIPGFDAGPGYDLDSGWGTIDAARFVPALVDEIDHHRHH